MWFETKFWIAWLSWHQGGSQYQPWSKSCRYLWQPVTGTIRKCTVNVLHGGRSTALTNEQSVNPWHLLTSTGPNQGNDTWLGKTLLKAALYTHMNSTSGKEAGKEKQVVLYWNRKNSTLTRQLVKTVNKLEIEWENRGALYQCNPPAELSTSLHTCRWMTLLLMTEHQRLWSRCFLHSTQEQNEHT